MPTGPDHGRIRRVPSPSCTWSSRLSIVTANGSMHTYCRAGRAAIELARAADAQLLEAKRFRKDNSTVSRLPVGRAPARIPRLSRSSTVSAFACDEVSQFVGAMNPTMHAAS
jgi:hypothetical protein